MRDKYLNDKRYAEDKVDMPEKSKPVGNEIDASTPSDGTVTVDDIRSIWGFTLCTTPPVIMEAQDNLPPPCGDIPEPTRLSLVERMQIFNRLLKEAIGESSSSIDIKLYLPATQFKDAEDIAFIREIGYQVESVANYEAWVVTIR